MFTYISFCFIILVGIIIHERFIMINCILYITDCVMCRYLYRTFYKISLLINLF